MNIQIKKAAKELLDSISAPKGMLNVLPIIDAKNPRLIVWIDVTNLAILNRIPSSFKGYPVSVEQKPNVVAYH